jgi:predicted MPP superfamily phosphohydrolase
MEMQFGNLPAAFCGYKILFLSDLHVDGIPAIPANTARFISDIDADLCLLGGDYRFEVFGSCQPVLRGMKEIVCAVKARDGIVGILGNHDFAEIGTGLQQLGVRMLLNESIELRCGADSIWLAGLDDPHFYRCDDIRGASAVIPEAAPFKIVLAHTPELYREAEALGYSLYLSGHTHGGQICTPGGTPIFVHARCPRQYARGTWQHGRMKGYTTTGVGASLLPVRFNCPPEVVLITLRKP